MSLESENILNNAVESGGSYEIIRKRLTQQGNSLLEKTQKLNEERIKEFGGVKHEIIGKVNVRTENNCIPVDMKQINGYLLFGYNVQIGMRSEIQISDVFGLYELEENDNEYKLNNVKVEDSFLSHPDFLNSFKELYLYYKDAKLVQIAKNSNYLLVAFQIGQFADDLKVFRWSIKNNTVQYVDDRGNEELQKINSHSFNWIETTRANHVEGKHPHVSILDKVFVETIGGDLTIKIENNTEEGKGIYSEPVEDLNQSLSDAKISYAEVGNLILLKITPYREKNTRYFVYNSIIENIVRLDKIGVSCRELPEGHGIVFSNGYYLENGDYKEFEENSDSLKYFTTISSPNGEDFLYIFFDNSEGRYVLYSYNLIKKEIENPIHAHGYSIFNDGKMVIFKESENSEPTKIHPLRIWQTPYVSDEYFADLEKNKEKTFLNNIGNSELVRGISDIYTVIKYIDKEEVTTSVFEGIVNTAEKVIDDYHWLGNNNVGNISAVLKEIMETSVLIISEFEKVKGMQQQSQNALEEAEKYQKDLVNKIKLSDAESVSVYVALLAEVKSQLGNLISIKQLRYMNVEKIEQLEKSLNDNKAIVNDKLVSLLQEEKSFDTYFERIADVQESLDSCEKAVEVEEVENNLLDVEKDIILINDEINEIEVKDATLTANILDHVSEVFAKLNQLKAKIKNKKKSFLSTEAKAEFASQFKLLSQSVSGAITSSDTPEECDNQLARLMGQIETLESKFSDFDEYITEIFAKRDEIQDLFESHKQTLVAEIQKRIGNIEKAAEITINSISKKVEKYDDVKSLNSYFASDSMVLKVYQLIKEVRELGNSVKADDIDSKLKKVKDQSIRSLRDNQDIFEDGGKIMKLGKHKFSVNKTPVDLTIIPRNGKMTSHLTATDYYEILDYEELNKLSKYWEQDIVSENENVYRSEFLAYSILNAAENNLEELSFDILFNALDESNENEDKLLKIVQKYSSVRYKEGYIKGIHDTDATLILKSILRIYKKVNLLKFDQKVRSYGIIFNKEYKENRDAFEAIKKKYEDAKKLALFLGDYKLVNESIINCQNIIEDFFNVDSAFAKDISKYILEENFEDIEVTSNSKNIVIDIETFLKEVGISFNNKCFMENHEEAKIWIESYLRKNNKEELLHFSDEIAVILNYKKELKFKESDISLVAKVEGLIGEHNLINSGVLTIVLDKFINKCQHHLEVSVPEYYRFIELRQEISKNLRESLNLNDFKANPLSSFVRNRLITESYFKLIGDNFAKQMGALGDNKRTDLMGMLLLISPPGYGKTTLIEYIANKLGLVFMKINCPSLGHSVTSLDPAEASDSTSRKELEKLNLALEMGNNVLLYLDDIQHTNPEFLQKFISLCDGTRRIEGVWKGKAKTYDLKGKKFAVCMAGNPYTESGDKFKIPDMLANRADIYNLGDMLNGQEEVFELSYIENSLTSNETLTPLANRGLSDLYKFIDMAKGKNIPLNELENNYSPAEANEIVEVLKKMLVVKDVVSRVNKEYIASASMGDSYRMEPPFKLQGSYRNMNKMVEKIVSVMNEEELENLIFDHYVGESQTLTVGAEENLLKLKEILGKLSEEDKTRWEQIKKDFLRNKESGGDDVDGNTKIANQLYKLNDNLSTNQTVEVLQSLVEAIAKSSEIDSDERKNIYEQIKAMTTRMEKIESTEVKDEVVISVLNSLDNYLKDRMKKNTGKNSKDELED